MASRSVECSIRRFGANRFRNISARIMIPFSRFHQWQANLRVLEVQEIKTVPYVPLSHPFVERMIGTLRRNIWTALSFGRPSTWKRNYRPSRITKITIALTQGSTEEHRKTILKADRSKLYRWRAHCRGLYQTPEAA